MTIVSALYCLIALIVAIQTTAAVCFVWFMSRSGRDRQASDQPKAAIILCLRGADPFLSDCLQSLLSQDYANYLLCVVVDSDEDPAWSVLRKFEGRAGLQIEVLQNPPPTCSLKCSSLVQAIGNLDASFQIVALCDADAVPGPNWLADLSAPLTDPDVGVATGNRWYVPQPNSAGSMIRYLWNVPAAVNMVLLKIAWGGSLAIRRDVIAKTDMLNHWSGALCEDTILYRLLRKHGFRQAFVPDAMIVNRESTTLGSVLDWVPRQMLLAKLYHPSWPATVGYGSISIIVPFLAALLIVVTAIQSNLRETMGVLVAVAAFEVSNALLVGLCQWGVRRRLASRAAEWKSWGWRSIAALPFWVLLSQLISPVFYWKCFTARSIQWRAVRYDIAGLRITKHPHSSYRPNTDASQSL
ncbi:glycosyltransferase [Rosistilla oblonga]|uniref:Glycosyl transferase family 2 n=1 Tax=Rosistilla oblonga TaxID=2527990 RepID=A0A518IU28_9BACT|nr:glycosyltransferase family 2 protein [Rosistilla oblonga]QDV56596.1 Glycosyl transferase family 2 [Rosistilla oblonga]